MSPASYAAALWIALATTVLMPALWLTAPRRPNPRLPGAEASDQPSALSLQPQIENKRGQRAGVGGSNLLRSPLPRPQFRLSPHQDVEDFVISQADQKGPDARRG
ncbi:MAG: hypothetical protein MZV70_63820 [Desulfobacterales bacterium]|nr:hypothetical protein [Desulfobacterales bacterium]